MEEIGLAATAYFSNCSNEIRQLAWKFFQSIDSNREGRVSVDQFTNFIQNEEWARLFPDDTGTDGDDSGSKDYAKLFKWVVDSKFFTHLDTNGDCSLDFSEFKIFLYLIFLYLLSTRHVWCSGCQAYLPGLYFTCLDCDDPTFDLCVACYTASRYSHHHDRVADSLFLNRIKIRREVNRAATASCSNGEDSENENGQEDIDCGHNETSTSNGEGDKNENGREEYPALGQNNNGMDLFHNAKVVRLRSCHNKKYLLAKEDGESVIQGHNWWSKKAAWIVEFVPSSSSSPIIRFRSCYGKYLTASDEPIPLRITSRKVLQTLPIHLDSSVEWEPVVIDGRQIHLKNRHGDSLLRAHGQLSPWRNKVSHKVPRRSSKQKWAWRVDIVDKLEIDANQHAPAPAPAPGPAFVQGANLAVNTADLGVGISEWIGEVFGFTS